MKYFVKLDANNVVKDAINYRLIGDTINITENEEGILEGDIVEGFIETTAFPATVTNGKWTYVNGVFTETEPNPVRALNKNLPTGHFTKVMFLRLFSESERMAFITSTIPSVVLFRYDFETLYDDDIDLNNQMIIDAIGGLQTAGLITTEKRDYILSMKNV